MPKSTESSPKPPKKPEKSTGLPELEARVVALEEKIAKYHSLSKRIDENAAAIARVRNCIGARHK